MSEKAVAIISIILISTDVIAGMLHKLSVGMILTLIGLMVLALLLKKPN